MIARRVLPAALAGAVLSLALAAAAAAPRPAGSVTFVAGEALRRAGGAEGALAAGSAVHRGDVLETGRRSRLEVTLADGSLLRLGPRSRVVLDEAAFAPAAGGRQVSARLQIGNAWASVAKAAGGESRFEIRTENAVAGVRGTTFRVDAAKDRSVVVKVYGGAVAVAAGPLPRPAHAPDAAGGEKERRQVAGPREVTKEAWERIVTRMMEVRVAADGTPSEPRSFALAAAGEDEFERWNRERDAAAGRGEGDGGSER